MGQVVPNEDGRAEARPYRREAGGRAFWVAGMAGVFVVAMIAADAQEAAAQGAEAQGTAPQESAPGQTQTFRLPYKADGFMLERDIEIEGHEVQFKAEPQYQGSAVIRGALPTGAESNEFIGFAFDQSASTLYLDLNRNLDLTDDPEGVHREKASAFSGFAGSFSTIENIRVTKETPGGSLSYAIDLDLSLAAMIGRCTVTIRSGWDGVVEFGGRKRHLAVIDNLDGVFDDKDVLILTADENSIVGYKEDTHPNRIPASHLLSFNGINGKLSFSFEGGDLVATFTEMKPELAELNLGEATISRLVLTDPSDWTVVLDSPTGRISVPKCAYETQDIYLDAGEPAGIFHASRKGTFMVPQETPRFGAPLKNVLDVERSGRNLVFGYRLEGAGGETYDRLATVGEPTPGMPARFALQRGGDPPEVRISKEGQLVASGPFEYG